MGQTTTTPKARPFSLPPKTTRFLKRMGMGPLIRKLKDATSGKVSPEVRAFTKNCRELRAKFLEASPSLDDALVGRVVTDLVEVVNWAESLKPRLRDMKRVRGREKRAQLVTELSIIFDNELDLIRRRVRRLRKNIPLLVKALGEDPSYQLLTLRRRRRKRR